MPNDGVVDKVAARLTMDITPAQQALKQLSTDYQKFNAQLLSNSNGDAEVQAMTQTGQRKRALSSTQQENLRQIQQDGELKRTLLANMYHQQMIQQEQDYNLRMKAIESDNQTARNSLLQQSGLRTVAVMSESQAKIESEQKSTDLRLEQEQDTHNQKLLQNQQLFEERMSQLKARGQQSSASSAAGGGNGVLNNLSSRFANDSARYAVGTVAGFTTFAVLDQLAKIPQVVGDISGSITKLKQVLELSPQNQNVQQLNSNLKELQSVGEQMAVVYGQNVSTVLDVMVQAGRRFKDIPSIIVATDNALQAMVADSVDAQTAIKGEEALMSQFGLSLSQTRDTWAKLTVASHEFLATTTDIINALERSGSSFKNMKVSTDGAIAAVVALEQESGRTGSTLGNTWKSLETTLSSTKGIEALHQLGIEAKSSNGSLEDGMTILGQLTAKWPELSEASRQAFATILSGGKYQVNQLTTFLNDQSGTYVKALNAMKGATVDLQHELVQTALESLPNQLKMTSAELQVLANSFSNESVPAMIKFFDEVRKGAAWLGDHAQAIEKLVGIGFTLAEAYVIWRVGLLLFNSTLVQSIAEVGTFGASLFNVGFEAGGVAAGIGTVTSSLLGLTMAATGAVAKLAGFVAIAITLNDLMGRSTNPLGKEEQDLNAKMTMLQNEKNAQGTGQILNNVFVEPFKTLFNQGPIAAGKQVKELLTTNMGINDNADINKQITDVQGKLDYVHAQQKAEQDAEFQKNQDLVNKMLQAAKDAGNDKSNPDLGNGPDNIVPTKASTAPTVAQQSTDYIKSLTESLAPYNNLNKEITSTLSQLTNQQQIYTDQLKYGATNTSIAADATATYQQRLQSLQQHQDSLHATNDQMRTDMASIAAQIQSLNPNGADVTTLSQGQQQAISQLTSQYDQMATQLDQNSKQWWTDAREMVTAGTDWLNVLYQLQNNGLKPLSDALHNNNNDLTLVKDQLNLANNELTKHADNLNAITNYTAAYSKEVDLLNQRNGELSQTNSKIKADNDNLNNLLSDLTNQYNQGKISTDAYTAAAQSLHDQIQKNNDVINQNNDEIFKNGDTLQQAADAIQTKIIDTLKQGYDQEKQLQDDKLKEQYDTLEKNLKNQYDLEKAARDNTIKDLQSQATAIDNVVKSLQAQWQAQTQVDKLGDLQNQLAQVMSQHNQVIVGTDGKLTYTYDQQKVTDLQKQISDQQTTMAHDAQVKQLQDQKDSLNAQIKNLQDAQTLADQSYQHDLTQFQNEFDGKKTALDNYWTYRLSQDQLQAEADRLVVGKGYTNALVDAQAFVAQMNAIMAQRQAASISAGQGVSGGLGQTNAEPSSGGGGGSGGGGSPQSGGSSSGGTSSYMNPDGTASVGSVEASLANLGSQYNSASSDAQKQAIHDLAYTQMTAIGGSYNDSSGEWTYQGMIVNGDRAGQMASLDTGGQVPHGRQGAAMLHQDEIILNSPTVNRLDSLLNDLPNLTMPQFSRSQQMSQTIQIDRMEFPNVRTASDAQGFMSELARIGERGYQVAQAGEM